jgi:glyoxylase-like metal-dependent hydrolase (beta-lactamase superfamily II)
MKTRYRILHEGYTSRTRTGVGSTVSLIRSGDVVVVVDPGLAASRAAILDPLAAAGLRPEEVTDVVFSHHHPDHTLNAALFPEARFHDHWAVYRGDRWDDAAAEGRELAEGVSLIETPGHTPQDISTLAQTDEGLIVFTHLWWFQEGPPEDPFATDPKALHANRMRVLELEPALIVPGHGAAFRPGPDTPR